MTDLIKDEISKNFKPVEYLRIEEALFQERQYTKEYSVRYFALTQSKDKVVHEHKRPVLNVLIRFTDNTAFNMTLLPEDYLGKVYEKESEVVDWLPHGLDVNNSIVNFERNYDYEKVLNTIVSTLQGKKQYNPTFETLDFITN